MGNNVRLDALYAAGKVVGASGVSTGAVGFREGNCSATARSAAGVYSITLNPGLDLRESYVQCALDVAPAADNEIHWRQTTDTNIDVLTFAGANVATDLDFKFYVRQVRVGT